MPDDAEVIEPFTFRVPVRASELEPTGRVAPATVLDYVQEAAGVHAAELGFGLEDMSAEGQTWVLARLRLAVVQLPSWPATAAVTTWPSGTDGLYATRDYLVHDDAGILVARGTSDWLILDVARRRPVRVPQRLADLRLPDLPRALPPLDGKLAPPESALAGARFHVRRSDLDLNRHVNNVRYADWAVSTMPDAHFETHRLAALDLHFRAETTAGDSVAVTTGRGDAPDTYAHLLVRSSDGREVAVARSRWAPVVAPQDSTADGAS